MSVAKSKNMGVDHSSISSLSTMRKDKVASSKKDLKIALVAKRLSMLQDDLVTQPVLSPENPGKCESTKPSQDYIEEKLSDDIVISKSSKNRTKYGSHKRGRVVSDDESTEEDRELISCFQPRKNGRTKQKKIKSIDSCSNENVKVIDHPRTQRIQCLDLSNPLSTSDKSSPMKRAEEVQANLSIEYPSFVKLMLKSHVSGGFWLGLPRRFCDAHLPIRDSTIVLVDEAGKEFSTVYLSVKAGLSSGWRGFSIDHVLLEGDVLIFHLIAPTKFKIYIIREHDFGNVDGALGLLTLDSGLGLQQSEDNTEKVIQTEDNCLMDSLSPSNSDLDLGSEVLDGICFSDSSINFDGVKSFDDFNIIVDGLIIDSKLSDSTRKKYYELCCSQKSFLHENFLRGLNCSLVVGIISETINIADAIKSCKRGSTSHEDLRTWEKTLKGFELLGMKVDFLIARVSELLGLALEFKADESKRLKESIIKRAFAGERMKALEDKLTQLKETMENIDLELENEVKMASAWKLEIAAV